MPCLLSADSREEKKNGLRLNLFGSTALPECIDYFHATDCFGRRGQFANIGMPDRIALLDRLTDFVLDRNIRLVAGVMDVPAYEAISPKLLENEFLGNKYAGTFGAPVEYACQLMNKPGEPMPHEIDDLCAFFIEENEYTPSAFRMLDNIRNDEILWWRKRIGSMTPGTKSGPRAIPLLQVGDLGAFLAAKKWLKLPTEKSHGRNITRSSKRASEFSTSRISMIEVLS